MHKLGRLTGLIALGLFAFAGVGFAGTVTDCKNCFGGTYDLTGMQMDAEGGATDVWRIFYTIDLTNADTGSSGATHISDLAFKVSSSVSAVAPAVGITNPDGYTVTLNSTISSSTGGCGGNGGSGWICLSGGSLEIGKKYIFTYDVTMQAGSLEGLASIKANWDPPEGLLISEKTSVPEGLSGELSLLIGGIGGLLMWRRRLLKH